MINKFDNWVENLSIPSYICLIIFMLFLIWETLFIQYKIFEKKNNTDYAKYNLPILTGFAGSCDILSGSGWKNCVEFEKNINEKK